MRRARLKFAILMAALGVPILLWPASALGQSVAALSLNRYAALLQAKAGLLVGAASVEAGQSYLDPDAWDEDWERSWDSDEADEDWETRRAAAPRRRGGLVEFRYADAGYTDVELLGDFNNWKPTAMELDAAKGIWMLKLRLGPGEHYYRFSGADAEGRWEAIDPGNADATRLPGQGWVSVLDMNLRVDQLPDERRMERRRIERELSRGYEEEDVAVGYQRVDGLSITLCPDHIAREDFEPSLEGKIGYGFKSKRWTAGLTLIQPLTRANRAWLRLDAFTGTDFNDQTGISYVENSLGAVFFRVDYRDYFKREGAAASLVINPEPWLRMEAGARTDDFSSVENVVNWSFAKGDFTPNPAVDEGTLRALFARALVGNRENRVILTIERAGEDVLSGDYDYALATARYRGGLRLGPDQALLFQVRAGSNFKGRLPRQRRFFVGGFGTVRGYPYQSLLVSEEAPDAAGPAGGERMLVINAAYRLDVFEDDLGLALLYDAGMAWSDRKADMELDALKSSVGLGVILGEDFHVNIMKAVDRGDRDPVVELRLQRSF